MEEKVVKDYLNKKNEPLLFFHSSCLFLWQIPQLSSDLSFSSSNQKPKVMNNLSNTILKEQQKHRHCHFWSIGLLVLISLFLIGLAFSIFLLVLVHNAIFFLLFLLLSALVAAFLLWNSRKNAALRFYLPSFPDSDLRFAREGDIVKITGLVSCGNVSLESSYEKVSRCIYTSTLLYEYGDLGLRPADVRAPCFNWRVVYAERFSTDFYINDMNSGFRALVKAGPDCKVIPLMVENRIVSTSGKCKTISSHLKKWLRDRNLPDESRLLRLEEGYLKEGSCVSVIGRFLRINDAMMIVQPSELLTTGFLWRKLLLPVDIDGLIIGVPETANAITHSNSAHLPIREL